MRPLYQRLRHTTGTHDPGQPTDLMHQQTHPTAQQLGTSAEPKAPASSQASVAADNQPSGTDQT